MILPFYTQKQILSNWCWAAVSSSIAFYYDAESMDTQNAIAGKLTGTDCSYITIDNAVFAPPEINRLAALEDALSITQNYAGKTGPLMLDRLIDQVISLQRPVACQITWESIGLAHFITIFGYEDGYLLIGDPESDVYRLTYDDFCAGYRGGNWQQSFLTKSHF